ncbi:MAG TPA: hypothetical protein IAD07_11125 [Candidatus Fimivicinus intestinavium]|nr:hypothetical protein [Candidatus Fimivicinus intestinavium]
MQNVNYRMIRMVVFCGDVEEEVMFGIEAVHPEKGELLDRVCRISSDERAVQQLADSMNRNELSLRHFRCVVDDLRE